MFTSTLLERAPTHVPTHHLHRTNDLHTQTDTTVTTPINKLFHHHLRRNRSQKTPRNRSRRPKKQNGRVIDQAPHVLTGVLPEGGRGEGGTVRTAHGPSGGQSALPVVLRGALEEGAAGGHAPRRPAGRSHAWRRVCGQEEGVG